MRRTGFILAVVPVFLLGLVSAFSVQSAVACCVDNDGDGYGVEFLYLCPHPEFDCDDTNLNVNPGVIEQAFGEGMCGDGVDNDCDTFVDMLDDGCFECTGPGDCDDGNVCTTDDCVGNACVHQNNTDPCDDQNACTTGDTCSGGICVGGPLLDEDQDTFVSDLCGGNDCNDQNPGVHPGVPEAPPESAACTDGIDNNCNGYTDLEDAGCMPSACSPIPAATASAHGTPPKEGSGLPYVLLALLLPVGAAILLRKAYRKR